MTKILLTGATGFVGKALLKQLTHFDVVTLGRVAADSITPFFHIELTGSADYRAALASIDVVVHCAARAHKMHDNTSNPLEAYREVNTRATLTLARQAAQAGTKRFIFISSVKVNGETTATGQAFRYDDQPQPSEPYGISKAEAEQGLIQIAKETGLQVVIIRPPLVYGEAVQGNFAALMALVNKPLPLPLAAINNKRSLVALDNLIDLILTCISHPAAANQIFLVSDDQDVSTPELLQLIAQVFKRKAWLFPLPLNLLYFAARLLGITTLMDRLCGNLQLNIQHTKQTLDWQPPLSLKQGIARVAKVRKC